jgi:hypothetical protein
LPFTTPQLAAHRASRCFLALINMKGEMITRKFV